MTAKRFRVINYSDGSGMYGVSDRIAEITVAWDKSKLIMDNLCDLLNHLHEENEQLEEAREYYQENFLTMKTERNQFKRENELLKFQLDECRNNKLFSRRELEKENEQLKIALKDKENLISICEKKFKELGYLITCDEDGYVIE